MKKLHKLVKISKKSKKTTIFIKRRSVLKSLLLLIPTVTLFILFVIPMNPVHGRVVNEGNLFGAGFCVAVALLWIFYPLIKRKKVTRIIFRVIMGLISAGLAWTVFLSINMLIAMGKQPPSALDDCTVIVLGCRVQNGVPSTMYYQRLVSARDYLKENETVMCVTTGGYGVGEAYSEAETGRSWLIRNNINESRIYLEDESKNTLDNLGFAREVIAEEGLSENIVIVSDGFHLWRAKMTAEKLFGGDVYVIPAKTSPPILLPTYWVREMFAITRDFINPRLFQ
ncbi:MAG: YdcF family protein [Oscillospiraceae bacterium]|nr:YdcF family protein [Oscillospiraceae bacterium]